MVDSARVTKVLIYGGCHALVLHDLLSKLYDPATLEVAHLINFHVIASGKPFPQDALDGCDALLYSPVENHGDYNTDLLAEQCRARGLAAFAFPWMEWHGYSPGAFKGLFKGRFQWYYSRLIELAAHFDTFESFRDHVLRYFPDDETIDFYSSSSLDRIALTEERLAMPIRISDFIKNQFRASRLFLISDHPSLELYMHVIGQIATLLRLPAPRHLTVEEPQWRWRTPILPRVVERLGLTFTDHSWIDDELIPGQVFDLETYLRLYYYKDGVILGPGAGADIHLETDAGPHKTRMEPATRIFADPVSTDAETGLDTYRVLAPLSDPDVLLPSNGRFAVEPSQWRSTWSF